MSEPQASSLDKILKIAQLYNTSNTFRNDTGSTKGLVLKDNNTKIGLDCSGFVYHVLREAGFDIGQDFYSGSINTLTQASWFDKRPSKHDAVEPGTMVFFKGPNGGHVGFVQSYDPKTGKGTFIEMSGDHNKGALKSNEPFTTNPNGKTPAGNPQHWGNTAKFVGFATINPSKYKPELDQHRNVDNPKTPVLILPNDPIRDVNKAKAALGTTSKAASGTTPLAHPALLNPGAQGMESVTTKIKQADGSVKSHYTLTDDKQLTPQLKACGVQVGDTVSWTASKQGVKEFNIHHSNGSQTHCQRVPDPTQKQGKAEVLMIEVKNKQGVLTDLQAVDQKGKPFGDHFLQAGLVYEKQASGKFELSLKQEQYSQMHQAGMSA